ncbi:hypothetical protein AGOR_G00016110 [Albula goreensis]|uniref:Optineurin n=1 Tax=Albula goreensis TaxID=1534307 RepID=A0A8T3E7M9_9TELE|nr:hypothetical protein AGOR_G00016110 [Albula goreensis]
MIVTKQEIIEISKKVLHTTFQNSTVDSEMASNSPVVNGDVPLGAPYSPGVGGQSLSHEVTLEDTIQQMKVLIKENSDLKVALRRTNMSMKERFEGLTVWKEKQKDERDFLEGKLEEARERVNQLSKRNDQLWKKLQLQEASAKGGDQSFDSSEVELMKSVIKKLQAEKSDLVALNSELQLKAGMGSPGDSSSRS